MLVPFIVTMGVGRGGGTSLLNLLLGLLKAKEGICICCRNWAWLESIAINLYTRECAVNLSLTGKVNRNSGGASDSRRGKDSKGGSGGGGGGWR